MIFIICATIILTICTITDLKGKYIYTWICGLSSAAAIIVHAFIKDIPTGNVGLGVLIGSLAFIVSIITKEKIGRGDAWIIMTIGALEGGMFLLPVLIWTFIFFNIYAISGIGLKYFNLKSKLPLAPFALLANTLVAFLAGGKL
ncbi:MAG: hypothetical protein J6W35_06215 [Eubacterium sp.]|nr:hypothetical protein [Eubacterium sp.]